MDGGSHCLFRTWNCEPARSANGTVEGQFVVMQLANKDCQRKETLLDRMEFFHVLSSLGIAPESLQTHHRSRKGYMPWN